MPMPNDGLKGLAPVEPQKLAGIMPNAQHQTFHGFMTGAPYELAIVEFDDQGRCYDRGQMDAVAARLDTLAPEDASKGQDVILVAFVHGWKHDARSDDDNLSAFRALLNETVDYEKATARPAGHPVRSLAFLSAGAACRTSASATPSRTRHSGGGRRPDSGWRSDRCASCSGGSAIIAIAAKGRRKSASGDRRPQLRRHDRLFRPRAVAHPGGLRAGRAEVTPEFAELVLLVNPAIEGARFLPIYDLVTGAAFKARTTKQLPDLHLRAGRQRSAGGNGVSPR